MRSILMMIGMSWLFGLFAVQFVYADQPANKPWRLIIVVSSNSGVNTYETNYATKDECEKYKKSSMRGNKREMAKAYIEADCSYRNAEAK